MNASQDFCEAWHQCPVYEGESVCFIEGTVEAFLAEGIDQGGIGDVVKALRHAKHDLTVSKLEGRGPAGAGKRYGVCGAGQIHEERVYVGHSESSNVADVTTQA
jgi:hypothetical protein